MPARLKTDDVDLEHLFDILQVHAKRNGLEQAFGFGDYTKLRKEQAVNGRDLAVQKEFVQDLREVSSKLLLKYSDLKGSYSRLFRKFPQVLSRFDLPERDYKAGEFATSTMTLLTHTRRLKDELKFREACRGLSSFYISRLQELRNLVMDAEPSLPVQVKAGKPGKAAETPEKRKAAGSSSWEDILEMEIPATQSSTEEKATEEEGLEGLGESPVPPRKKDLKSQMRRPAAATSPKKATKKPASLKKPVRQGLPGQAWFLMPYNEKKNWSVAVRERGGKQVVAVSKFGNRKENMAAAGKLMKMLEAGKSLTEVQEAKQKL